LDLGHFGSNPCLDCDQNEVASWTWVHLITTPI
jgi:hypothetical protein